MARAQVADGGRNLTIRIVSATVLGAVVIAALYLGAFVFSIFVVLIMALALTEWIRMAKKQPSFMIFGSLYIGLSGLCIIGTYLLYPGPNVVVTLFLLVSVSDISAYAVGKTVGGPKLVPKISPNKTWAGAAGGIIGPLIAATGFLVFTMPQANPVFVITLAFCVALATELGDLLESAAKRHFGVKDSGWIIPGHGGILDRIDGLLLAAPVFLIITTIGEYTL